MTARRADTLGDLEHEVGVLIRRVRRVIGLRARAVHPDLMPSSYLMLAYVAEQGPLRASEIAEQFDIDKGAVSRQVAHLTELGLLARVADPEDGRALLVSVSEEGRTRLTDVARHRRKWLDERLGDWSEAELTGFVETLGRYNRALDG
ncbi:MarR family transcriptional regulator [Nocardioides agariphilus]|jgi:DNA-binding MarR family transcriptional regulator|uniref:MarR family transcriptional regulator n=1 Tax=Nocardioides agariphilus TaxID=433664 RepID=A0A930YL10_9ACTN|nr:MarR family transcriptional regulator [Nocardioides agariphilus]MBF4766589.1 MarR family transcriptional regulator [Nocardioides agariphilus]